MRRFLFAVMAMSGTAAAFAAEPLMVRIAVYQRVPLVSAEGAPEPDPPAPVRPAPPNGWPSSYEALRDAITARQHGRTNVFISDITTPKPLTAGDGAAFFLADLGRPIEVKANGDVLLPNGRRATIPVASGSTSVLGASDEKFYVGVSLLPPADVHDDTMVIFYDEQPLNLLPLVAPETPA